MTSWPWSAWNDDYNLGPYLCDSAMELLSGHITAILQEPEPTTSNNYSPKTDLELASVANQGDRNFCIVGALASMWNLANIAKYRFDLESLQSVIKSCLCQQSGTLAVLQALGQVQELTLIGVCTHADYEVLEGMLTIVLSSHLIVILT